MRLKRVDKELGKTIMVMILDAYQEYCNLSYPKDPSVYRIKANPKTASLLEQYFSQAVLTKEQTLDNWGFKIEEDPRLLPDEIIFGPEQITIKWNGK